MALFLKHVLHFVGEKNKVAHAFLKTAARLKTDRLMTVSWQGLWSLKDCITNGSLGILPCFHYSRICAFRWGRTADDRCYWIEHRGKVSQTCQKLRARVNCIWQTVSLCFCYHRKKKRVCNISDLPSYNIELALFSAFERNYSWCKYFMTRTCRCFSSSMKNIKNECCGLHG